MSNPARSSNPLACFRHAFAGLWVLLRTQRNAQFHFLATVAVIAISVWLNVTSTDWCLLILAMAFVWIAEALNTSIEFLADAACPEHNELIKKCKDVAAGSVLLAAIAAVTVGLFVFWSYLPWTQK